MQITDKIIMIRPKHFGYNVETAKSNTFQQSETELDAGDIQARALEEFDRFVDILRHKGITVDVIEDTEHPVKPDAIFPNNWISMHATGAIVTYPMYSEARRRERRDDIIAFLKENYMVNRHYAFEQYEAQGQFLEGTGSMVIDHDHKRIYACLSPRTEIRVLDKFRVLFEMHKHTFHALYQGTEIYHTNVVMALGEAFVVCCMDCISDEEERHSLETAFLETGKELIAISIDQMASFAGNMLQLRNANGDKFIVMSTQAYEALTASQKEAMSRHGSLLHSPLDTVEYFGGGSARCMMAENFLPPKE